MNKASQDIAIAHSIPSPPKHHIISIFSGTGSNTLSSKGHIATMMAGGLATILSLLSQTRADVPLDIDILWYGLHRRIGQSLEDS